MEGRDLKNEIVNVKRIEDRTLSYKLALEKRLCILLPCILHKMVWTMRLRDSYEIH